MSTLRGPFLIFVICILSSQAGASLAVDSPTLTLDPPGELQEGMTLTISCTVPGLGRFDIPRISRKYKDLDDEISTNGFLSDNAANSGRYTALETINRETYRVQITDLRGADGGTIVCAKLPQGDADEEDITIEVSPQSVNLYYLGNDGERVDAEKEGKLNLGQNHGGTIICETVINGTIIQPTMRVLLNGADFTGRFETEERLNDELSYSFLNIVRVKTLKWVMNPEMTNVGFNGMIVECSAKLPEFLAKVASAIIEVEGSNSGVDAPTLTIDPPGELCEGMTVTILCTVPDMRRFDVVRIIRGDEGSEDVISDNEFLTEDFISSDRYRALEPVFRITYGVQITELRAADGGRIVCTKLPERGQDEREIEIRGDC